MGVLQRFERRIEELVNKPFAKAFKAEVEPVEIASALQRECDDRAAIVARGTTMVPNDFVVELGPRDHERLSVYAEPLSAELSSMVREHVEEQRYTLLGPVSVHFEQADDLDTGMFRIRSTAVPGAHAAPPPRTSSVRAGTSTPWLQIGAQRYPLQQDVVVLGRGADADLRIDDPGISRRHAELRLTPEGVVLRDLQSTNGVQVDGARVSGATLREGNKLQLGNTMIVFHEGAR